jgi:hypothetical protein
MKTLTLAALGASMLLARAPVTFANCAKDDPTGAKVLAARQQAISTCPCATATNHGAYVKCVVGVAKMLSSGTNPSLPKSCKGAVKKCEAHSTCGKAGTVTCCLTTTKGTTCKIMKDAAHCTKKKGTVGTCTSCCDACPAPGSGPSCSTITPTTQPTTTTTPTGTVVKGSLTATPGRFNYHATLGLPGANAACNTSFPGTHACTLTELQGAPASDLIGLQDTTGMVVTSLWAIDPMADPITAQCCDDVNFNPCTSAHNWEYATAHTASRGQWVSLNTSTGALGALQTMQQCNFGGGASNWVACCQ